MVQSAKKQLTQRMIDDEVMCRTWRQAVEELSYIGTNRRTGVCDRSISTRGSCFKDQVDHPQVRGSVTVRRLTVSSSRGIVVLSTIKMHSCVLNTSSTEEAALEWAVQHKCQSECSSLLNSQSLRNLCRRVVPASRTRRRFVNAVQHGDSLWQGNSVEATFFAKVLCISTATLWQCLAHGEIVGMI